MSQPEPTGPIGNFYGRELPGGSLPKLTEMAREAYQEKRTKDCLDLTRAMLLLEPENEEAHQMRSSIRSEMHQDLESARAVLRQAQFREEPESSEHTTSISEPDPSLAQLPNAAFPYHEETFIVSSATQTVDMPVRAPRAPWLKRAAAIGAFCLIV